jgi:trimeric autotransporter adhesin
MADSDQSIYNLRYNQIIGDLEGFGGGSPQWTVLTLHNVDPTQVPISRLINTTGPLTGGGNLSTDLTLSIPQATSLVDGFLSHIDWSTFNNKQAAGSYITALTGDATATGPGSVPLTLATVNGTVGTFTYASVTVNGKGLITSASNGATGSLTALGTDGIVVTGGTGAVLGAGTSLAQHVADATHSGYLSSTDWNRFNGDTAGITALTGDVTATGPGSAAATLATVNSNVGSFTYASITVNGKGLVTAASSGTAPVTSVSGTAGDISSTGGTTPVIDLVNTAVSPNTYTNATITVDQKGRITSASSGTAGVTSVSGTANQINSTGGTTPVLSLSSTLVLPGTFNANGTKLTNIANGTAATDAAAFGQIGGTADTNAAGYIIGTIVQVVTATSTTDFTTTSSSFQTTNSTATITPKATTHKIRVTTTGTMFISAEGDDIYATLTRGGINLAGTFGLAHSSQNIAPGVDLANAALIYLDSPVTTSATTYAVAVRTGSAGTAHYGDTPTQYFLLEEIAF